MTPKLGFPFADHGPNTEDSYGQPRLGEHELLKRLRYVRLFSDDDDSSR
jgi:hypothetical protein